MEDVAHETDIEGGVGEGEPGRIGDGERKWGHSSSLIYQGRQHRRRQVHPGHVHAGLPQRQPDASGPDAHLETRPPAPDLLGEQGDHLLHRVGVEARGVAS
jgi:hypothetical protein